MKLKKFKFISIFIIFFISFFTHYGYNIVPNFITSLFFPINESVFEHFKMIFSTYLIYFIIEFIFYNKNNLNFQNIKSNYFLEFFINLIIFILIYLPYYFNFKHNVIITLIIYFLSISITQYISYKILLTNRNYKILNKYYVLLLFIFFIIFIYFTYNPLKTDLFIDKQRKKIGFKNYY